MRLELQNAAENIGDYLRAVVKRNGLRKDIDSPVANGDLGPKVFGETIKFGGNRILDAAPVKRFCPVEFVWTTPAERVLLTGSFLEWKVQIPLSKKVKKFYAKIDLPKGRHEFKFIVNGVWKVSPNLPTCQNNNGDVNNYVDVF